MLAALVVSGCVNLESVAPPASPVTGGSAHLTEGRQIFLMQCTTCHAPDPVSKYNRARWQQIVSDMTDDANLTPQQERALRDYLAAVALP